MTEDYYLSETESRSLCHHIFIWITKVPPRSGESVLLNSPSYCKRTLHLSRDILLTIRPLSGESVLLRSFSYGKRTIDL